MQAIVFDRVGLPTEVLELREVKKPAPAAGEVLVQLLNAPINQGDFLFIRNLYPEPKRPAFPAQIAGNYGTGIVMEKGPGANLAEGTLVAINYYSTWAEYAAIPEEWLIPLPSGFPPEKAAQMMPMITAWDVVEASGAKAGNWIAVTAANSANALMIMQLAIRKGIRVIALVRKQPRLNLISFGAEVVIDLSLDGANIPSRIREITAGKGISAIVDAVGGPLLADLIRNTSFGARIIMYGGLSDQRFELHNNDIYLNGLTIMPYIYRHFFTPPAKEENTTLRKIIEVASDPSFIAPVSGRYTLDQYQAAVKASFSSTPGSSSGKGLFIIGSPEGQRQ
ncbi:MAG: zinc-binding dehydrogenase [Bacteroidetes bacterium]|nr:zinc-binding dehydrogenase [Bacteroidota bacterium]